MLANLAFFAWTQGYIGAFDDGHEPQRFAQQVHPEKLSIELPARTSAAEAVVCRLIDGLRLADAEALKVTVESAGGKATVLALAGPIRYVVAITDLATKAAADQKAAELMRFGVKEYTVAALEGGRHEIVLGSFATEAAASEFLQGIEKRRIRSAQLVRRESPAMKAGVEARAPASMLLRQLPPLIAPYAGATVSGCAP